jgi:hypothetical protein
MFAVPQGRAEELSELVVEPEKPWRSSIGGGETRRDVVRVRPVYCIESGYTRIAPGMHGLPRAAPLNEGFLMFQHEFNSNAVPTPSFNRPWGEQE